MKHSLWLRIVHSGDWCLRSTLRAPGGACHKMKKRKSVPTRVNIHCLIECADEYVDFYFMQYRRIVNLDHTVHQWIILFVCLSVCLSVCRSSDAGGSLKHSAVSPPAGTKFPRGISSRRTFHGQIPGRRSAGTGGSGAVTDGTDSPSSSFGNQSSRLSFLNKLTSKFARR